MKKKFVVALVAAMSLTVAGTGTVFAMDKVSTVASEKEHVHGDNCEWIVDKEAWTETVEHPEEGHWVCNGEPQEPEQKPENPDVETPDAENPETPEQKPEANKENVPTQETETKKEGTTPKTGDTASALPVAGAGLASLGVALATILKKRK